MMILLVFPQKELYLFTQRLVGGRERENEREQESTTREMRGSETQKRERQPQREETPG